MRKDRAVPCPLRCVHLLSEFQSEWNLDDKPKIRRQHAKYKCNKRHRFKVYSFVVEFFYGKLTTNQKWSKRPRSTLLSVLRVLQLWEESLSDLLSARLLQIPDLHLLSTKPAKFTEMSKAHHELIVIKRVYGKAARLSTVSGSKVVLSVSRWRREAAHLCTNYTPAHAQSYTECVTVSAPSFTHLLFTPARNLSFWTLMSHHRQM